MPRKQLKAITLEFQDGSTRRLEGNVIDDPKSGVLFWGDHAVENLLAPFYAANPGLGHTADSVQKLWQTPNAAGELPAFLVKPICHAQTPDQLD